MIAALIAIILAGAPAVDGRQPVRHGSHAAQHGGQFVGLWNDTVHIEGVWQEQRRFRLYIYDASSRPIPPASLEQFRAVIVNDTDQPLSAFRVAGDGTHLEARIASLSIPAVIAFVLTRPEGGEPERIGMSFSGYTVEPPSFETPPTVIPDTLRGVGEALRGSAAEALSLVEKGENGMVYAPAIHTRDLLLALGRYVDTLPSDRRREATAAIDTAVRAAWLLHVAGDLGTPVQVRAAALELKESCNKILAAFNGLFTPLP